jgi:hypothetical protein
MLESKWWTGFDRISMRRMSWWIYFMQSQAAKAGLNQPRQMPGLGFNPCDKPVAELPKNKFVVS